MDRATLGNVYHVSEFCQDIHKNMLRVEKKWNPDPSYMLQQKKIDETIRSTLVDWLIQIHYNFKLWPETLFLTHNLIDRFLAKKVVTRKKLQVRADQTINFTQNLSHPRRPPSPS